MDEVESARFRIEFLGSLTRSTAMNVNMMTRRGQRRAAFAGMLQQEVDWGEEEDWHYAPSYRREEDDA